MKRTLTKVSSATLSLLVAVAIASPAQAMTVSDAVAKIEAMIAEMEALKAELSNLTVSAVPTPAVQGVQSGSVLTMDLSYGVTNDDIARVQRLLATDPTIYEYGVDSGFFGPKTQEAVRNFQARFGLDTVGVIGPSTTALLELFLNAYPDEDYPADVLKQGRPSGAVLGESTTSSSVTASTPTPAAIQSSHTYRSISIEEDNQEFVVRSYNRDGSRNRDVLVYPEDMDELYEMVADELGITEAAVRDLADEDDDWFNRNDEDEEDAEKAIEDADDALDEVRDLIDEAEDDDIDTDEAQDLYDEARDLLDEAEEALEDEDYDEAVELAEEAEELAEEAEDELDDAEDASQEIDEIKVEVGNGESEVTVEYENGDEDEFDVDEDDQDDIIEAVADELDIDEDEVEDLIEFEYGDIDRVLVVITEDSTRVRVYLESGVDLKYTTDETDEDEIAEAVADEFDLDEDEVERALDVDDRR